jgi:hypothetical protein
MIGIFFYYNQSKWLNLINLFSKLVQYFLSSDPRELSGSPKKCIGRASAVLELIAPPYNLNLSEPGLIFTVYIFGIAASSAAGTSRTEWAAGSCFLPGLSSLPWVRN